MYTLIAVLKLFIAAFCPIYSPNLTRLKEVHNILSPQIVNFMSLSSQTRKFFASYQIILYQTKSACSFVTFFCRNLSDILPSFCVHCTQCSAIICMSKCSQDLADELCHITNESPENVSCGINFEKVQGLRCKYSVLRRSHRPPSAKTCLY